MILFSWKGRGSNFFLVVDEFFNVYLEIMMIVEFLEVVVLYLELF